jgi:hypothetical protein
LLAECVPESVCRYGEAIWRPCGNGKFSLHFKHYK